MKRVVENWKVYGLEESIKGAKYPMSVNVDTLNGELTPGIANLAKSKPGEGHDQWLTGVIVQFDLTFSIKAWTEAQRYHFLDFISSQSTMHRAAKMDFSQAFNGYVTARTLIECNRLKAAYQENPSAENYLKLLYNLPTGTMLTARMTTNYRQLKTIYRQRKDHRLPEWREFCRWIETLPHSELITGSDAS